MYFKVAQFAATIKANAITHGDGGKVVVWPNHGDYKLGDFVARAGDGWHHSTWDERTPIHVGRDKVHLKVKFSRWREDGSRLGVFETGLDVWYQVFQVNFFASAMLARGLVEELKAAQ